MNQFIETSDTDLVRLALAITDSVYPTCLSKRPYLAIKKIGMLSLLQDYESAYLFVDSLKEPVFNLEYQKIMYYHILKARHHNQIGQFSQRDIEAKIAVNQVEQYLNENPNSVEAIIDLAASTAIYMEEDDYYSTLNKRIANATFNEEFPKEAVQNSVRDIYMLFNP